MPKKQFSLEWAFEHFQEDPSFYTKMRNPEFENTVDEISQAIQKNDPRFGIFPKEKKKSKKKKASKKKTTKKKASK